MVTLPVIVLRLKDLDQDLSKQKYLINLGIIEDVVTPPVRLDLIADRDLNLNKRRRNNPIGTIYF